MKEIYVLPGLHRTSLQYHEGRTEHWTVVEGRGLAFIQRGNPPYTGVTWPMCPGFTIQVQKGDRHRLTNPYENILRVIEVAWGDCREDDIVRLDDDYGRTG